MSLIANLPEDILGSMIDKKMLLAGLIVLVVIALFRYLQIYLLLTISILAIGANLPDEMAFALGISRMAMLISLGILIAIALLNRVIRLLPVGLEAHADEINDARQELMAAIARGDQATVNRLLVMNVNVNFSENGTTPLHLAAEKGYPEIVRVLIQYGADYRKKDAEGKTALEIALSKKKFIQTTEILHNVISRPSGVTGQNETRRADADLWQKQHHT